MIFFSAWFFRTYLKRIWQHQATLKNIWCIHAMFHFKMLIFQASVLLPMPSCIMQSCFLLVWWEATRELCTNTISGISKTLHLLDETIVIFTLFISLHSSIMLTSLSEDCTSCGNSFKTLGAHLVRSLACGSYFMPPCRADTDSNVWEGADHGTCPNLRCSWWSSLFCANCATARGQAEDNPPIINVDGVDDEDFVVIDDEDDTFPDGNVDEEDAPTDASEGEEGPNASVLNLYLNFFGCKTVRKVLRVF